MIDSHIVASSTLIHVQKNASRRMRRASDVRWVQFKRLRQPHPALGPGIDLLAKFGSRSTRRANCACYANTRH